MPYDPKDRQIEFKWVLKIKGNGVYCIRLTVCEYSQSQGVNIFKNYLLVMNDIKFWVLLLVMIHFRFAAEVVHLKTAFQYRELEEDIYIECPPSMKDVRKCDFIIFGECIYGPMQAA